jgi:hypothetical protein
LRLSFAVSRQLKPSYFAHCSLLQGVSGAGALKKTMDDLAAEAERIKAGRATLEGFEHWAVGPTAQRLKKDFSKDAQAIKKGCKDVQKAVRDVEQDVNTVVRDAKEIRRDVAATVRDVQVRDLNWQH